MRHGIGSSGSGNSTRRQPARKAASHRFQFFLARYIACRSTATAAESGGKVIARASGMCASRADWGLAWFGSLETLVRTRLCRIRMCVHGEAGVRGAPVREDVWYASRVRDRAVYPHVARDANMHS